jgi:hypothetical protein
MLMILDQKSINNLIKYNGYRKNSDKLINIFIYFYDIFIDIRI